MKDNSRLLLTTVLIRLNQHRHKPALTACCAVLCCVQRWITFQLLHALSQAHAHGVCHGDIKCENVMVTSWNWVFLTDFASYKPTYLPADNPVSLCLLCAVLC